MPSNSADRTIGRMTVSPPLPLALHSVLRGLEHTYVQEGAAKPDVPSIDLWANLLRAVNSTGIDRRELPAVLRLSNRAVRTRVSTAVRHGWVEHLKGGRRGGFLRLTSRGSETAVRWKALQDAAEHRWKEKLGFQVSHKLRASLEHLVAAFPLEHPHYPASYGAADATITGGYGVDWTPVYRTEGSSVMHIPFLALLSQTLVAFAMQYEEMSYVAFFLSTNVIRQIPAEGLPLRELVRSPGVSALVRHGFIRITSVRGRESAFLTARGLEEQRSYEKRIQTVESIWRKQFGEERITALNSALGEAGARNASHPGG